MLKTQDGFRSSRRVIDGADSTLDQMERVPVNPKNRPLEEIKLNSVSCYRIQCTTLN